MKLPGKLELILYGLLAAAALGLVAVVKSWHDRAVYDLPAAKRAAAELQSAYTNLAAAAAANQAKTERHGHAFDDRIEEQHAARADTPTLDVRLCPPARVHARAAGNTAVADHAQGGAQLPEEARPNPEVGRNVGAELYGEADRADETAIALNACIDWVNDHPAAPAHGPSSR